MTFIWSIAKALKVIKNIFIYHEIRMFDFVVFFYL
eukprot:UN24791